MLHVDCLVTQVGFGLPVLIIFLNFCTLMLALSNDVETNPEPAKSCPVCHSNVPLERVFVSVDMCLKGKNLVL